MTATEYDLEELRWRMIEVSDQGVDYYGATLPLHLTARLRHPAWEPIQADVTIFVDRERGPVVTGIAAMQFGDRQRITSLRDMQEMLRRTIEEKRLLQELTGDAMRVKIETHLILQSPPDGELEVGEHAVRDLRIRDLGEAARARAYKAAEPRRRRTLTREYLQKVAEVYRDALADGLPPTVAVQEAFQVSHSNAAKYVKKARDAKLLRPANGTRGGEVAASEEDEQ